MSKSMSIHAHAHQAPYPTAGTHAVPLPLPAGYATSAALGTANPSTSYQPQYQYQQQYNDHTHQQQHHQPPHAGTAASAFPPFQLANAQQQQQQQQQQQHQHQQPPSQTLPPLPPQQHLNQSLAHPSATTTAPLVPAPPPPSDIPSGLPLPPAYREKVQQLKAILLDRKNWKVCRGTPTSSHKVPPGEFDAGELVCRNCKQHDPKFFLEPEQADAKIKELLSSEPCHFVPRYDQAGCGVDRDRPNYDSKDWTTWALKPNSRGTVLRERLWQCCLGGGRKAAAKYRAGQAKNTTKIGCPRSLYAVTRWDAQEQCAKLVEIYFKHKHLPECYEHASTSKGGVAGGDE